MIIILCSRWLLVVRLRWLPIRPRLLMLTTSRVVVRFSVAVCVSRLAVSLLKKVCEHVLASGLRTSSLCRCVPLVRSIGIVSLK